MKIAGGNRLGALLFLVAFSKRRSLKGVTAREIHLFLFAKRTHALIKSEMGNFRKLTLVRYFSTPKAILIFICCFPIGIIYNLNFCEDQMVYLSYCTPDASWNYSFRSVQCNWGGLKCQCVYSMLLVSITIPANADKPPFLLSVFLIFSSQLQGHLITLIIHFCPNRKSQSTFLIFLMIFPTQSSAKFI